MINRRNFLRNIGMAGALVAAEPVVAAGVRATTGSSGPLPLLVVKGSVLSKGKGLAGVAVTDGFTIVWTDTRGQYTLEAHPDARFVYISVPAGHAFPAEKGIAKFYQPLQRAKNTQQAVFELEALSQTDLKHQFVLWADTQMISAEDAQLLKTQSVPDLQALLKTYPAGSLFHGIGCGDLVWDKFELFKDYKEAIGLTGIPFFSVIGNHDMDLTARGDDEAADTYQEQLGPTYYSFNRGRIHYVVLDDVFYIGVDKKYIGYVTDRQLNWLEQDLKQVKPGSTVVVSLHIPTNTGVARRSGKEENMGGTVTNRKHLYKLLAPYNVHILSGHTHFNESWEADNIMEHNHGTVCGAWWTGPVCSDGTPSGYGVYEVNGDDISWYYKSTGLDRSYQVKIHPRGADKKYPDEIIANVWNWDTKWKVEWWEDGAAKGSMTQFVGLDPQAVELYAGPELPRKHRFVEPTLADHLFRARPSAGASEVKVVATDRFGNKYESLIRL